MNLFLIRHGEANHPNEDTYQGLSAGGKKEIIETATWLASLSPGIKAIWHSPKLRAAQSAEILKEILKTPETVIEEVPNITPISPPRETVRRINETEGNLVIVGHMPHLAIVASLMLTGQDYPFVVSFDTAGIFCLSKERGVWKEEWYVAPGATPPIIKR